MSDTRILSVKPMPGKATGPHEKSDRSRVWNDMYVVTAATSDATGNHVLADPRLPQWMSAHPADSGSLAVNRVPKRQLDPTVWYVSITWDSNHGDTDRNEDPTDDPFKWDWGVVYHIENPLNDLDGEPYADVNGTPFNPPPDRRIAHMRLTIRKNALDFDHVAMAKFSDAVNQNVFWGRGAGQAKMDAPVASEQFANGQSYWQHTYAIEFKPDRKVKNAAGDLVQDTWNPVRYKNEGPKILKKVFDRNGNSIPGTEIFVWADDEAGVAHGGKVLLDKRGFPLGLGVDVVLIERKNFPIKDFDALQINI